MSSLTTETEHEVLSDATPIDITYITNDGSAHVAVAEAMQQDFAAIGVKSDHRDQ